MSDAFLNFASYGRPDEKILMDYNFWVIRNDDEVVLLDTGYDVAGCNWLDESPTASPLESLAALDIDPLGVSTVIASHFHYDHIGFLRLFGNARVIAAQAEYDHWTVLRGPGARFEDHFVASPDLDEIYRAESEGRLVLVPEGPTEVVPGVTVYPVGGHTPGQLITLVRGRTGSAILTSDAAHLYEQIHYGWPFFAHSDLDQVKIAYRVIDDLAAQTGAVVVPGHDSRVREHFPPYPGQAGAFATMLTPHGS
ncbi:N-acyl homoserine lactonase family protein [Saccharopolyspora sp. TS4A08]|uniref:N-acyl homoserine lactonase family protein n=1 Tax=Saccharopolyspora ipomoeae TaxID=3042027 RepID=A0ABT6PRF5_9PSEU|nr:N-acyl homoserine lactonase family protein [Saccharopolyspora sp. TS4A08]MDI2030553.1 N-acyl homoserine lactonase family protein [Saccharopolyspora sp. TS4A08]